MRASFGAFRLIAFVSNFITTSDCRNDDNRTDRRSVELVTGKGSKFSSGGGCSRLVAFFTVKRSLLTTLAGCAIWPRGLIHSTRARFVEWAVKFIITPQNISCLIRVTNQRNCTGRKGKRRILLQENAYLHSRFVRWKGSCLISLLQPSKIAIQKQVLPWGINEHKLVIIKKEKCSPTRKISSTFKHTYSALCVPLLTNKLLHKLQWVG